jgi:hypothetical protein
MTRQYIGTKEILAWPQIGPVKVLVCGATCHKGDANCNGYCEGLSEHAPDAPAQEGYAVKYPDGYISWSPKAVFEAAYRVCEGEGQALTFGDALHFLKQGKRVARAGWNGKGMWLGLHKESGTYYREACGTALEYADYITMKTADNKLVPRLCSQTDALAEDWMVLP